MNKLLCNTGFCKHQRISYSFTQRLEVTYDEHFGENPILMSMLSSYIFYALILSMENAEFHQSFMIYDWVGNVYLFAQPISCCTCSKTCVVIVNYRTVSRLISVVFVFERSTQPSSSRYYWVCFIFRLNSRELKYWFSTLDKLVSNMSFISLEIQ